MNFIGDFVLLYPIVMSTIWIVGSLFNKLNTFLVEKQERMFYYPKISILLPCFNEVETIEQTVQSIMELDYPKFELVMIDDCSQDETLTKMIQLKQRFEGEHDISIIHQEENGGKARGLNRALMMIDSDYCVVMDSDSSVEKSAVTRLMHVLLNHPEVGAVTGAPIIRNRTSLLGKLQTLEYVGIIGNIKQAQNFYLNHIMTISGVLVCYRVDALKSIHYFNPSAMTEDIDATWRLYTKQWKVAYEPTAHCYILAPETIKGLLRQRTRWAVGGLEVFLKYGKKFRQMATSERFLIGEMFFSNLWSIGMLLCIVSSIVRGMIDHSFAFSGIVLGFYMIIGLIQFSIGYINDHDYAYLTWQDKWLSPIYIFIYWMVNMITALIAMGQLLLNKNGDGKWESSDRGL